MQPDSIIPGLSNPQSWNRYSYVQNQPINYSDPSGHMRVEDELGGNNRGCSDPKYCQNGKPKQPVTTPKRPKGRGDGHPSSASSAISYTFDSQELANQHIPFTASQWGNASLALDRAALAIDSVAALIVLGHVAVGAAGGLSFEGNPVTGGVGAAAGYIVGEMNPVVRGLVGLGNGLATAATYAGLIQAEKTGDLRVTASLNIDQSGVNFSAHGHLSGNTATSVGLTTAGLFAQPVSLSLPLQLLAVMNDEGSFPLPAIDISIGN